MDTLLLKGKPVADVLQSKLRVRIDELASGGTVPNLAAILVGDDPASKVYVRNKGRAFEKLDCTCQTYNLSTDTHEKEILDLIDKLNHDMDVHGILVQLPLPQPLDS